MQKRALGKGLDALIPKKTTQPIEKQEFVRLSLAQIKPSVWQPRQETGEKEMEELRQSIEQEGIIQPVIVRKLASGDFELVAGSRRYEAAKMLDMETIPAIIKELSDKDTFVLAIVENLQRKDLNPLEEAEAFKRLMHDFKFSLDDIARFVCKDKTTVANSLRLLKLPQQIRQALREGLLARTQARTILALPTVAAQLGLFREILDKSLSVRDIEKKTKGATRKKKTQNPFLLEMEGEIRQRLGTKVTILNNKNNKGKIVVEYYSLDDLERIAGRMK